MNLLEYFKVRSSDGQPLVLATVFETVGSTYSKAGGQMIIDSSGNFCGMLSGGCLEGDLVERARRVVDTCAAETASYDLSADDELWGLGVGCDGTMRVLLQPLTKESGYQPFATIAEIIDGGHAARVAIVIAASSAAINVGATAILHRDTFQSFGMDDDLADSVQREFGETASGTVRHTDTPDGGCTVLYARIEPPPALLVLGAGLDSEPVIRIAHELGWRCAICDHRPAYIESRSFPARTHVICCAVDELHRQIDLDQFDTAIVMSHHLASDRSYLRQLATSGVGYIGLLGPIGRRNRLLRELDDVADALRDRLHGPAGIDLGGRGPGPIALSIIAEMQQYLSQRG